MNDNVRHEAYGSKDYPTVKRPVELGPHPSDYQTYSYIGENTPLEICRNGSPRQVMQPLLWLMHKLWNSLPRDFDELLGNELVFGNPNEHLKIPET
jgi:hypothetical protein